MKNKPFLCPDLNLKRRFAFVFFVTLFIFVFSAMFLPTKNVLALTPVSGEISTNTTWTKEGNPYFLNGNLSIKSGVTLTIGPGVIIKGIGSGISVQGELIAVGTADEPIYFTSVKDDSIGGDTNGDGGRTLPSNDSWYIGGYFGKGITLSYVVARFSSFIQASYTPMTLFNVQMATTSYGVYVDSSKVDIKDSVFSGAVFYEGILSIENSTTTISGSSFSGGKGPGITVGNKALLVISSSTVANFSGAGIDGWGGRIDAYKVRILNNGGGIYLRDYNPLPTFIENLINSGKKLATSFLGKIAEAENEFFVSVVNSSTFFGNKNYALRNVRGVGVVDARENYWGDISGPRHNTINPGGMGGLVTGSVLLAPWLTTDSSLPPAPTKPDPVIIIPGILGSAEKNGVWVIDPIFHTYDDLIDTLDANGYEKGADLFTFPYDWRFSNVLTAVLLKNKIAEVKNICDCDKVDLVAHSMGGLVARQYIQSNYYAGDVDQLIFLGTPHLGAPKAYLPWEGATMPKDIIDQGMKLKLWWDAKKLGMTLFDYIRGSVTSVKELLPIYDYLVEENVASSTISLRHYPTGYPTNIFLENLKTTSGELASHNIRISNFVGNTGTTTISVIQVQPSNSLPIWPDGEAVELFNGIGDETVPLDSASYFSSDITKINSSHIDLPSKAESLIYKKLTGKDVQYTARQEEIDNALWIKMFSPADIQIIAPDGKKVGKDFTTGQEINEIDGAFYSGFQTDDEYVTIPNPLDGEYKVVTQGVASGGSYTIATGYITDTGLTENDYRGQTLPGMISAVDVTISSSTPEVIEIEPEDNIAPTITISLPLAGDYPRGDLLNILVDFYDEGTGVFSSGVSFDDNQVPASSTIDTFYQRLGAHTLFASSTDFALNLAISSVSLRIVATPESTISDIERAFLLGWIEDKKTKEKLIKEINAMVKLEKKIEKIEEKGKDGKKITKTIEKIEKKIDKVLAEALKTELKLYNKGKVISDSANEILQEDIQWLIDNN